jgi:hypothetical protein
MRAYNLGFLSDAAIYEHVKATAILYKREINLAEFNRNLIDPIKLTFDAKIYGKSFEQIVESECVRQIDKANTNHIGYFHQNLFRLVGNGWKVPDTGFDIINDHRKIYVELKNKHNTMNASSAQSTYMSMQQKLLEDPDAHCLLVEVIATKSQDILWEATLHGRHYANERIRRVSIDKFYEIVFNDRTAFMRLCRALPIILDDVVFDIHGGEIQNSVYYELRALSQETLKSLYLLAFKTYEGFEDF